MAMVTVRCPHCTLIRTSNGGVCFEHAQSARRRSAFYSILQRLLAVMLVIKLHATQRFAFLAHLSRRLIGELLVYRGIRCPSTTFSNNFFSEAAEPILLILHI